MSAEYPLRWPDGWPRRHGSLGDLAGASPRRSGGTRETISVDAATRRLRDELWRIPATDVVITMDKGGRGGVAAYFRIGADRMALAQDGYRSTADNARSLAIAVNGMRAATRHGGDFMQKRAFSGFTALPPPAAGPVRRQWWEVLGVKPPAELTDVLDNASILVLAENAWRKRAAELHPDRPGGSAEAMAEANAAIDEARELLGVRADG